MCLRTVLISWMEAPLARSRRVMSCFSASVMGGTGRGKSAEAPPEIRQIRRSRGPAARAISEMRLAPSTPLSSGTGWPHSLSRTRPGGAVWPYLTLINPPETRRPSKRATARAITALALPAPIN